MSARKIIVQSKVVVLLVALLAAEAQAETQLADTPISGASSIQVSPNIQFILDDSASMNDSYLPDWAGVQNLPLAKTRNASFNGIAYNPAVSYTPPKYFGADGSADTTTYLSQSSDNTAVWKAVKNDGYGVQSKTTSNLIGNAYYFTTIAGEYCANSSLKTCVTASTASSDYPVAAKLRWCKTAADAAAAVPPAGACQATQIEPNPAPLAAALNTPFTFPRMPSPRTSTITISGSDSTAVTNIEVNGRKILSAATKSTPLPATLANAITDQINACTFGLTGNCQVVGYSAEAAGNTVTISAPDATGAQPAITQSDSMTILATPFARPSNNLAPGENLLTVITDTVATVYPKSAKRSDCAADPCTYIEEMTNYANWWAYYSTRMQTMKTAASLSFEPIGSNKRIGYSTINNNTKSDFQNIAAFDGAQKKSWYDKLFAATPQGNTPLRAALADIGRLYAGQFNGSTFNGTAVVDPVQYYCQQNVAILSTDGYWNEAPGYQLDGTTAVGDQDGPGLETRPQLDGGGPQAQQETLQNRKILTPGATWRQQKTEWVYYRSAALKTKTYEPLQRTSGVEFRDAIVESSTSQLELRTKLVKTSTHIIESQTSKLQERSGPLQRQTLGVEKKTLTKQMEQTSQLQRNAGQRQSMTYQLQQRLTQVLKRTSSNGGTSWTDWGNAASCTPVASGIERTQCWTLPVGDWNPVSSCTLKSGETTVTDQGSDGEKTTYNTKSECRYQSPDPEWVNVSTCTGPASAVLPADYSIANPIACRTISSAGWDNVSACTRDLDAGIDCRYGEWTSAVSNPSCTPLAQAPDFSVAIARKCSLDWSDDWADSGSSCTANTTTKCQYKSAWSGLDDVFTCTPVAASSGTTLVSQVACPIAYGAWADAATCTKDTTGHWRTDCQYTEWTSYGADPTCPGSELPQSTGPNYTVETAKQCLDYWTDYVTTGTCTPIDNVTACYVEWSPWSKATSTCTPVAGETECHYKDWSGWSADATCSAAGQSPGPDSYPQLVAKQCRQATFPTTWTPTAAECVPSKTRQCRYADWSAWSANPGCTEIAQVSSSTLPAGGARQCQIGWTEWGDAGASCTTSVVRQCAYADWSGWSTWPSASECTDAAQSSGPTYAPARQCLPFLLSDWSPKIPTTYATDPPVFASGISCTEGTSGGVKTSCRWAVPPPAQPIPVAECVAETLADGTVVSCSPLSTGPTAVAKCTPSAPVEGNKYVKTTCLTPTASGQTPDTLADVAEYYWKTDLRDPALNTALCTGGPIVTNSVTSTADVCSNDNLTTTEKRQFMNTYTLGLGASGLMQYQPDYPSAASGDYYSVAHETQADPGTGVCSWQDGGVCNWPKPESNKQSNIDDLWHAAVNGRGTYFSADNPASLAAGISNVLTGIDSKAGSLSAVTVTSANLGSADDAVFEISFTSGDWSGEMVKRAIDATGTLSTNSQWSAQAKLDALVSSGTHTARRIYTLSSSTANNLRPFQWSNLSTDEQNAFKKPAIGALSQFCTSGTTCLAPATQDLASGENLLNFVRGEQSNEDTATSSDRYYRKRLHLLGDIVGSEAVYVKGSPWNYADYGYAAFKTANTSTSPRKAMVYVGANDGMLHAFAAADGVESWAYIPALLIPKLYTLADKNYPNKHQFFVDGAPVMGDICVSDCSASGAVWKTILVGGLNHGGRGYYALDITDPDSPKALWEFANDNLGYSYGNPVISKLKDGTWVVMFSSGYNNVNPGDGGGHLFILNADTGKPIVSINSTGSIATGAGDTTTGPSGLSRISAWANYPDSNNTALRVYGGDLLGNLWRFDINGDIPASITTASYDAQRLATLTDGSNAQPITSRPELGQIKSFPVVFVATGQLLSTYDLGTTQTQSIYAIKDRLTNADYGSPRSLTTFVNQTLVSGTCTTAMAATGYCTVGEAIVQGGTAKPVDFTTNDGWYADFPVAGERVNTDLRLIDRTLIFNTNTPKLGACVPVGVSFAYYLDYRTGTAVEGTNGMIGKKIADALATTPTPIRLSDGTLKTFDRTDKPSTEGGGGFGAPVQSVRRVSWRELVTE